jgi:hypothetical protein
VVTLEHLDENVYASRRERWGGQSAETIHPGFSEQATPTPNSMTNQRLSSTVRRVALLFGAYVILGGGLYWKSQTFWYPLFKDVLPMLIAIPAAYLAYSFQRRASYLQALRELWKLLIPAVQRAIQYTYLEKPDPKEFGEVMRDLSTVVDSLRGVFRNVPAEGPVGLYPYEPLKDIWEVMSWLRDGRTEAERYRARRCIRQLWYDVHAAMLLEFDREVPVHPVSKYLDQKPSLADKLRDSTLTDADFRT